MTPKEKKLVRWIKRVGANLGQLDILVEDVKCQQANRINTSGLVAQVCYLLRSRTALEIRKMVWHEMKMLQQFRMVRQSKTQPKQNKRRKARG